MKQIIKLGSLLWLLALNLPAIAQPCNLSGTYTIGPGGTYATITAALNNLRATGLGGPVVLELKAGYTSGAETFPLAFFGIPCISATNTVTLRPEVGATNLQITGGTSGNLIGLGNCRYITIDGRPGGTGTTRALTITNNSTTGNIVSFSSDASYNTFTYLNLNGATTSISSGVISFLSSTLNITSGNSFNTISYCNIGNAASNPLNGIYALGSAGRKNTGNKILNCNIYDFYSASSSNTSNGIYIGSNNTGWEISGNSIYQTQLRGNNSANFNGINIVDNNAGGFVVQNNFIGGTAPNCGGSSMSYSGTVTGINMSVGTPTSLLQGNTVSNINWRNYFSNDMFTGIQLVKGRIDCNGNTIGSQTLRGAITTTSSYLTSPTVNGIHVNLSGTQTATDSFWVRNNSVGGIYTQQDATNYLGTTLRCIVVNGLVSAYADINGNTVGSPTVNNSIETANAQDIFTGIAVNVTNATVGSPGYNVPYIIANNQLANMSGRITGIAATGGLPQVRGNSLRYLIGAVTSGIQLTYAGHGSTVSGNRIYAFISYSTGGGLLAGILADYSGSVQFSGNFIHSFQNTGGIASQLGIRIANSGYLGFKGLYLLNNNMIQLGTDTNGGSMGNALDITGISAPMDSTIIAHNSICIGGNGQFDGDVQALSLNRVLSKNCRIVNNILQGSRFTGINSFYKGTLMKFDPAVTDLNGVLLNNNIYYSGNNSTPTVIYKGTAYTGIVAWRAASGRDSNSVFYNPNFINPQGNVGQVDLHLASPNPAEGQGVAEATVTTDFDGQTRSNLSPVDIGADAGNFVLQDGDAPVLKHAAFGKQQLGVVVTYKVSITDNGAGVDTGGSNKPRMWFRQSFPTVGAWQSIPGQLTQGSTKGGEWSFAPDFAAAGISLAPGDSIAYYFVAQDRGPLINIGYSNSIGTAHTDVNAQVSPPNTPLRLLMYGIFPDTVYVGNGQPYTSLTGNGGFFQAAQINEFNPASAQVQVIITSDLAETGTHFFTMLNSTGPAIRIGTNTPTIKRITNSINLPSTAMVLLKNIYNLTIDGSVNGTGRYLHFENIGNTPDFCQPVLETGNTIANFALRNCIFSSNTNANFYYMVTIGGREMNRIVVAGNLFTNPGGSITNLPKYMLGVAPNNNDTIWVRNNEFANAGNGGLSVLNSFSDISRKGLVWVDSNHFYHNSPLPSLGAKTLLSVTNFKVPVLVSNNFIGGSDRFCGGSPWIQNDGSVFRGIYYQGSYDTLGSIQGNTVNNIRLTGAGALTGIYLKDGIFDVGTGQGNRIGSTSSDSGLVSGYQLRGIEGQAAIYESQNPLVRIANNIIAGTISGNCMGINFEGKRGIVSNNSIFNHRVNNSFLPGYKGIRIWLDSGVVASNTIYQLRSVAPSLYEYYGIDATCTGGVPKRIDIVRNRIYNLQAAGGAAFITGIRTNSGQYQIENNQIKLFNEGNAINVPLRGIHIPAASVNFTISVDYNTCVVGGTQGGNAASHAVLVDGILGPIVRFSNNLLVNQRTGGTGGHYALGMVASNAATWPVGNANNNRYVVNDTATVNQWMANGAVNMNQWRSLSQGDGNSFAFTMNQLPPDSLFVSLGTGNLDINPNTAFCWKVNQKGKPVATIGSDYGAVNVRSVDVANGKTDIGADEFDANIPEPSVVNALCPGAAVSITSDITGSNYQWQVDTGSGFVNLASGGAYSGATTATLSIGSAPSAWYGYQYRCVVNGGNNSQLFVLRFANVFTGAVSSAWENAANWSCGLVPDGNTDVVVNSGSTVVVGVNSICRTLTIRPGGSLTVAAGVVLTITN